MTSAFRTTALAAALAAFSWSAAAAPVTLISLNFEEQGQAALAAEAPVLVSEVLDVFFDGAWGYEWNMLSGQDPMPTDDNTGGFLINRSRDINTTSDIVVSLEDLTLAAARAAGVASAYPGQFFKSISFSLFSAGPSPKLKWNDAKGEEKTVDLTPGNNDMIWSKGNGPYGFDPLDKVTTLVFSAQGAVFGLDDLEITLTDANPGGGGNVPEPTSYALVGLALLAAGSASRRRA